MSLPYYLSVFQLDKFGSKTFAMRQSALLLLMVLFCLSGYAQKHREQSMGQRTEKERAIESQIDAFLNSWNRHDFSDMKNYIAEDCDFVNITGMHWKGRENIQYAHQTYHDDFFKATPMEKRSVRIRFLKPDVAIAHMVWHIGEFIAPDGKKWGGNDDLATIIFVQRGGEWMITALENVQIVAEVQQFDPVKIRAKSTE